MTKFHAASLRLLAAGAALLLGATAASAQITLKFAAEDKELYPTYVGNGSETLAEKPGTTVELIRLVAQDLGFKAEFVRAPWRRCLDLLKEGAVDAVVNGSFSAARLEFGAFPMAGDKADPARRSLSWTYTLYRKKGSPASWDGKAFSGLAAPIGAPLGYSIVADLKKLGVQIDEAGDAEINLRKVSAGRISGAVLLREATDPLIKSKAMTDLEVVLPPIEVKDYYIMLSHQLVKKDAALAERFWTKFAEIRDAKGAAIEAKY
ncbi:MAG: transporter substrate-binding domain-containing protein [Rhodospirillales bacterium]|nr:transporter substrate-binding domain-containing protein [Rhodospirillales bacterium]